MQGMTEAQMPGKQPPIRLPSLFNWSGESNTSLMSTEVAGEVGLHTAGYHLIKNVMLKNILSSLTEKKKKERKNAHHASHLKELPFPSGLLEAAFHHPHWTCGFLRLHPIHFKQTMLRRLTYGCRSTKANPDEAKPLGSCHLPDISWPSGREKGQRWNQTIPRSS